MSEIKIVKRIKFAGDVHAALMELGWDAKTAAAFLDSIPDADAEKVFEQMGLVKEAFEMAKANLVAVVRCKDCKYFHQKVSCGGFCKCGEVNGGQPHMRVNEDFCSYGERRADE